MCDRKQASLKEEGAKVSEGSDEVVPVGTNPVGELFRVEPIMHSATRSVAFKV